MGCLTQSWDVELSRGMPSASFDYDSLPHRLAKIEGQMVKQSATPIEPERVYKCMVVIGGFVDAPLGKQTCENTRAARQLFFTART